MSIVKALYFLIFQISITESMNKITEFDVYFLDSTRHLNQLRHDASVDTVIAQSTYRLVVDFKEKVFIKSGTLMNSGFTIFTIQARLFLNNTPSHAFCHRITWIDKTRATFVCNETTRYLILQGAFDNLRLDIDGYQIFEERHSGCFAATEKSVSVADCHRHCMTGHKYFGLQRSGSSTRCICPESLTQLTFTDLKSCQLPCPNAERRLCGGLQKYFSVYAIDTIRGVSLPFACVYNLTDCPDCIPGRKGLNCEIIDCDVNNGLCGHEVCISTQVHLYGETSVCLCRVGYEFESEVDNFVCKDLDECKSEPCGEGGISCINNLGSFSCICHGGYKSMDSPACEDVDECAEGICDSVTTECKNAPGTWECVCKPGFTSDLTSTYRCEDINECNEGRCDKISSTCLNAIGTFSCKCHPGFESISSVVCIDIDECATTPCDELSTACHNGIGTFECFCKPGFMSPTSDLTILKWCTDIDECLDAAACDDTTSECDNVPGTFVCNCRDGYRQSTTTQCEDVDECTENICETSSTHCINQQGYFYCDCIPGFSRETDFRCQDIDECSRSHPCESVTTYCNNVPGTFTCNCKKGFSRENSLRCKDIDECLQITHTCGKQAKCVNNIGSYMCICPPGTETMIYEYTSECHDIDECSRRNECDSNVSVCLNLVMGYVCQCLPGYVNRDNFTCRKAPSTKSTTLMYDSDDYFTTTIYDISTESDFYQIDLTLELMFIMPFFIFLFLGTIIWCYILAKKANENRISNISTVTTTSYNRFSKVSMYFKDFTGRFG